MKKQKGGGVMIGIGFGFALLVLVGVVVVVLYVAGIIGKKASSTSKTPVGPSPNPSQGLEIKSKISNPVINYALVPSGAKYASQIQFQLEYDPNEAGLPGNSTFMPVNWVLNQNITVMYSDGSTNTTTQTVPGAVLGGVVQLEPFTPQPGFNRMPVRVEFDVYLTYQNQYGITITSPVSNKLSVQIPPPK